MIVAVSIIFILFLGVMETVSHRRNLMKIPLRILVNGTRGKTSVTRLVASALNEAGLTTYAKTTGSDAKWIMPDGSEKSYRGNRMANIIEQIPFVRMAAKNNAQAIVVECMALQRENQQMMAQKLVCPHYTILTNAFVDHIDEIGATEEETVDTLSLSVWTSGSAVTSDRRFAKYIPQVLYPDVNHPMPSKGKFSFPVYEDNLRLVHALTKALNIPWDTAVHGMLKAQPDIGMCGPFYMGKSFIVNAFAANDPHSFMEIYTSLPQRKDPFYLLYNHRNDRGYRLRAFIPTLLELAGHCSGLAVIGENKKMTARYLQRKTGLHTFVLKNAYEWIQTLPKEETTVLCFGNIKGDGQKLIEMLLKEKKNHA